MSEKCPYCIPGVDNCTHIRCQDCNAPQTDKMWSEAGLWYCAQCFIARATATPPGEDFVNHPHHYTQGKIEAIDAIESALTPEEFRGYLKGTMLKYTWRMNHKGNPAQDLDKCRWYADRLAKSLKPENVG